MDNLLMEKAKELAARNYSLAVFSDETQSGHTIFMAKNPELYGCMAQGDSLDNALANLEEARIDYIYSLLEDNLEVPDPTQQPLIRITTTDSMSDSLQNVIINIIPSEETLENVTQSSHRKLLYEAWIAS